MSLTTEKRAIRAVKEFEAEKIAVSQVVIEGRTIRLVLRSGEEIGDDFDRVDTRK